MYAYVSPGKVNDVFQNKRVIAWYEKQRTLIQI